MHTTTYETPLILSGPLRSPIQMLAHQEYDGHKSLHVLLQKSRLIMKMPMRLLGGRQLFL